MKARYLFIAAALLVAALLPWLVLRPAERANFELPVFGDEAPASTPGAAPVPAAVTPDAAAPEEYAEAVHLAEPPQLGQNDPGDDAIVLTQ